MESNKANNQTDSVAPETPQLLLECSWCSIHPHRDPCCDACAKARAAKQSALSTPHSQRHEFVKSVIPNACNLAFCGQPRSADIHAVRCPMWLDGRVQCRRDAGHELAKHEYEPRELRKAFPKWDDTEIEAASGLSNLALAVEEEAQLPDPVSELAAEIYGKSQSEIETAIRQWLADAERIRQVMHDVVKDFGRTAQATAEGVKRATEEPDWQSMALGTLAHNAERERRVTLVSDLEYAGFQNVSESEHYVTFYYHDQQYKISKVEIVSQDSPVTVEAPE